MNQKLKVFIIMLITCFCGISQLYSQEQTVYHKKLIEIKKSFLIELFVAEDHQNIEKLKVGISVSSEEEIDNAMQQMFNAWLRDVKQGKWTLKSSRNTAVININKFIDDVSDAEKLKSTNATEKEFDDARERKINQCVGNWNTLKQLIIEMR